MAEHSPGPWRHVETLRWFLLCLAVCLSIALAAGMIWDATDGYPEYPWGRDAP